MFSCNYIWTGIIAEDINILEGKSNQNDDDKKIKIDTDNKQQNLMTLALFFVIVYFRSFFLFSVN